MLVKCDVAGMYTLKVLYHHTIALYDKIKCNSKKPYTILLEVIPCIFTYMWYIARILVLAPIFWEIPTISEAQILSQYDKVDLDL